MRKVQSRVGRLALFAIITVGTLGLAVGSVIRSDAQDNRSLHFSEWDVAITAIDTTNNVFHVTETQYITVDVGPANGGDREIPLGRITSINNIQLFDGDTQLRPINASADNCPETRGIVCLSQSGGQQVINYNFVAQAGNGALRTIRYEYDVHGDLRSYTGGDQFDWLAISNDHSFPIQASRITVQMPANSPAQVIATYPGTWKQSTDPSDKNTLIFTSPGQLSASDGVEVRVQYPHNPTMAAPPWQAADDAAARFGPILEILAFIVSALILIGGLFWVYLKYTSHKRGLPPIVVPEYLTEPPSDQPPAVVGTLIEEASETKHVIATLVDLARRGFIVIEQQQQQGIGAFIEGMMHVSPFVFHRTDQPETGLHPYEQMLLRQLFMGGTTRSLNDLRNTFYTTVEQIQGQLYQEVVSAGYFRQSPQTTRMGWIIGGGALLVVGGGAAYLALSAHGLPLGLSGLLPFPLGAVGLVGIVMMLFSNAMPSRTPTGEQESAKWKAFRTYLKNIRKYTDLKQATDQFDKYIGYATAFGLDNQWIHEFTPVLTTMPTWYYPTYMYGPWTGRYPGYGSGFGRGGLGNLSGSPVGNFGGGSGGGFDVGQGLNQASANLSQGLNAMSSGLTNLLNSAASTMTSRPSSSGSSGGFSGGHSGGGGGGGGGHSGFH